MSQLRKIVALERVGHCPDPGRAPEVIHLTIGQLVVNEEYQRGLSKPRLAAIRRQAKAWDWNAYEALNVAATDNPNIFEVVDGQGTAIAAATNGNIGILPCLLMAAETLQAKARAFVNINTVRAAPTPQDIYKGKLAAEDPVVVEVQKALDANGCRVVALQPAKGHHYRVGDTLAIATLIAIAKDRGPDRLSRILNICVKGAAAPVSSGLLKAVNLAYPMAGGKVADDAEKALIKVIGGQGSGKLEMMARGRTPAGARVFEVLADLLAELGKLPERRMGRKSALTGRKTEARPRLAGVIMPGRKRKAA